MEGTKDLAISVGDVDVGRICARCMIRQSWATLNRIGAEGIMWVVV